MNWPHSVDVFDSCIASKKEEKRAETVIGGAGDEKPSDRRAHHNDVETREDPIFGVAVPTSCPEVPADILWPKNTWADAAAYDQAAKKLASLFRTNFEVYVSETSDEVQAAGPRL